MSNFYTHDKTLVPQGHFQVLTRKQKKKQVALFMEMIDVCFFFYDNR
jgi:hypothetical protein